MKTSAQYQIGIDLGTTNTVVAYAPIGSDDIQLFAIEQLVGPGEVAAQPLLPSLRFHATAGELAADDLLLPWPDSNSSAAEPVVIGRWARHLGGQVPGRLVASAKSWLSHAAVDRSAPILPWGGADDVAKISPLDASASYLAHVRAAWNQRFPQAPLEQQEIVLTVPASFDEGARELTLQAARDAGLPELRLLEEPQAAFYDWLFRHKHTLSEELGQSRLVLICDVGGGTTDLSLIRVELRDGQPQLSRIGVGNHLMLGGDNMDLALAHLIEPRLGETSKLSAGRMAQLIERCRAAKEQLLAADAPEQVLVTLLGGGSRLIGGSRSAELRRDEVMQLVVDGFFPRVAPTDLAKQSRGGLVEFGLPFAADAAVTRHIASFLQQHAGAARTALGQSDASQPAIPDTLLLNGGVFRAAALEQRLTDVLGDWHGQPLKLLHNHNPDVAVARGAVAYALARQGNAPRIGGGAARSYFLLLEQADGGAQQAVCLLPRGSEPGQEIALANRSFALRLGQPVRFHLLSSVADAPGHAVPLPGELVDVASGDFTRLPPIATVLPAAKSGGKQEIPVQLATALTEIGTLQMFCVDAADAAQRWQLEFQLRGKRSQGDAGSGEALPPRFNQTIDKLERVFGNRSKGVTVNDVKQLRAQLEKLLGERDSWSLVVLRHLFDALLARAKGRRRSAEHERLWLNLAGFCLRPGYGHALDDWRCEQLWQLFEPGVQYGNDAQVCVEWWTLWRRIAGGLPQPAQLRLMDDFALILDDDKEEMRKRAVPVVKGTQDDMIRLAASLERIPAEFKYQVGAWLFELLQKSLERNADGETQRNLWAIARLGTRQPLYGSAHDAIPPIAIGDWLQFLLQLDWKRTPHVAASTAHLARMTGDRSRDIDDALRDQVLERLASNRAAPALAAMVSQVVRLDAAEQQRALGEALPPGLKLLG